MFKTPKFWNKKKSFISTILLPITTIFIISTILRRIFTKTEILKDKFIICIGNATVGGTGKTPTTIALYKELNTIFPNNVCIISKGYGRKTKGFLKVNSTHTTQEIGDEPKIISQTAPIYLFSKIQDIQKNILQIQEQIIITDDGLQNPSFHKNFTILTIEKNLFGNNKIFPSGPLREPPSYAISKSNAILFTENPTTPFYTNKPFFYITKTFSNKITPQKIIAFSGIANNSKFYNSLIELGFEVEKFLEFPDHYPYKPHEINKIINLNKEAKIITTEKDWVKLTKPHQKIIHFLKLEYHIPNELIKIIITEIKKNKKILYKQKIL